MSSNYKANYDVDCQNCGHSPTVTVISEKEGEFDTGLCGACAFGEAVCVDPDEW